MDLMTAGLMWYMTFWKKTGNVFTAPVGSHFHKNLRSVILLNIFILIPINFKRENSLEPALEKTKGSHVARRNGWLKCGSIERNRRYGGERNARADRELAPKGDMENDRRKWEWPLQVAQGTGKVFWFGLDKTKSLAWGTSWQWLCVGCVKATEWNENGGDPALADTP